MKKNTTRAFMTNPLVEFWKTILRILRILVFRVDNDQCLLRASGLSFQSVLSIVPLLAVMFGIAKGFGIERLLEEMLRREFQEQQEVISYFIKFGYTLLAQAQGGIIAGIGIIFLLFTVMRLFSSIESSLNYMWGVKTGRTLSRKASDYLALILICPLLLAASSSMTVFVTTRLEQLTAKGAIAEQIGPIALVLIPIIPYIVSSILFAFVYMVIPNTQVRILSATWAGIFAGSTYQILQATYISIQIQVTNAGAIYGSFAALPLFFMWLYLSWLLFLIGAQIMVIHQERLWDPKILDPDRNLTPIEKQLVSLSCVKACIDSFFAGKPITIEELGALLKMPERQVTELVEELVQENIIFKIDIGLEGEYGLVPTKSPDTLKIFDVLGMMQGKCLLKSPHIDHFEALLNRVSEDLKNSKHNLFFKDISIE